MTWTLTFSVTFGRDEPEVRDEDNVGSHHDVGPIVGFTRPEDDR